MINILSMFSKQVHCPNNLADGLKTGVIYHGVSKNFMTGLAAFTTPFFGVILERKGERIENKRMKYLNLLERQHIPVSKLDDFILLSESAKSYWLFSLPSGEETGSIGTISKPTMTSREFILAVQRNINRIKDPKGERAITGEYLVIKTFNKIFNFHL